MKPRRSPTNFDHSRFNPWMSPFYITISCLFPSSGSIIVIKLEDHTSKRRGCRIRIRWLGCTLGRCPYVLLTRSLCSPSLPCTHTRCAVSAARSVLFPSLASESLYLIFSLTCHRMQSRSNDMGAYSPAISVYLPSPYEPGSFMFRACIRLPSRGVHTAALTLSLE